MFLFKPLKLKDAELIHDHDAPETSYVHQSIIASKPFLKRLYTDFYQDLKKRLPGDKPSLCIIEMGSGPGFIKQVMPEATTSDLFTAPWIDKVFPAEQIPYPNDSVDAFLMLNVFHHLPKTEESLAEMNRCLRPGGKIIMIEPAHTPWQYFVTKNFHKEHFDVKAGWGLEGKGRLSVGNHALPWIVFTRDKEIFYKKFPELRINAVDLHTPFRYILSGGLSYHALLPNWMYGAVKGGEFLLSPLNYWIAFFQTIEIEKVKKQAIKETDPPRP